MRIKAAFAHLHSPLFFAKVNWGDKIDVKNTAKGKVELTYDRTNDELEVTLGNKTTFIPKPSIFSWEPLEVEAPRQEPEIKPEPAKPRQTKLSAQASGPNDHVFAGPGSGKTNDK